MPAVEQHAICEIGYSGNGRVSLYCAGLKFFFNVIQRVTVSQSESSDTQFFNSFGLVLGILIFVAIVLFGVAREVGASTQAEHVLLDPLHVKEVDANIAPFAHEAVAGQDNTTLAVLTGPKPDAAAADVPTSGEEAFSKACSACHGAGINGAPKAGDHAAWGPRIAQGKDALYAHAIAGKGNMPARGGTTWPDATIKQAVDYMVSLSK
jgi:cytochrome c5